MRSTEGRNVAEGDGLALYRTMRLIRQAEERLAAVFADGEIPGFIHLSIGQEAVAAGVLSALGPDDTVASNHRGHGHALAKGLPLDGFFCELMGKEEGFCKGRGGSMHIADVGRGMLGANGIVGGGISLAVGSALAHRTLERPLVSAVFFGDGALAEGIFHESLNLAAIWSLPVLFVCENNGWSEFSPTDKLFRGDIAQIGAAFGVPFSSVDGNDAIAVATAARAIVATMRHGGGPVILECKTERVRGHFEGDAQKYRSEHAAEANDPLVRLAAVLAATGIDSAALTAIDAAVAADVERGIEAGRRGSTPRFDRAFADVYTRAAAHG